MIKRVLVAYCTAALLSAAHLPAQAQTQSPAPQAAPTTAVSKDEVQKFANAIKQILVINRESEKKATQAIKDEKGLTEQRFDEIYKAQKDPKAASAVQIQPRERQSYDRIVTKLVQIQKDSDTKVEEAVKAQKLEMPRFNQIFEAAQKSPQLRQEIQKLVTQK
ncbi:MAG: DUF4168 domain-containing protein [Phormidesmis sp. CAN_BIN36]|nr:DUF4168 domain-containing protein [Phormidesmis sp. CAN_BIN36]